MVHSGPRTDEFVKEEKKKLNDSIVKKGGPCWVAQMIGVPSSPSKRGGIDFQSGQGTCLGFGFNP